jgi:Tfp pilus assembly protein PilN
MHPERTNLLPEERVRTLQREYFARLLVVALLLTAVVIGLAGVMLLPTHVFLRDAIAERTEELAAISDEAASAEELAFEARLASLAESTKRITELSSVVSPSKIFSEILLAPRSNIVLTGLSFTVGTKDGTVAVVNGRAKTRNDLRAYQLVLQGMPFAASASLPVSAYAKDADIDFVITITLKKP